MKNFKNLKVGLDEDLEEKLKLLEPKVSDYKILRKSLDARGYKKPYFVYEIDLYKDGNKAPAKTFPLERINTSEKIKPVIIVGSGPAGLFAALRLSERGIPSLLLEQGTETKERLKDIAQFWRKAKLNPKNNVCHGEGGAGLFSDGKLITRIKSPHISYVMNRLVKFGAPAEIEYLNNPHVGSDKIRRVIPVMRSYLLNNLCKIQFNTKVKELAINKNYVTGVVDENGVTYDSDQVILACGHSANDLFSTLRNQEIYMESKSFAIGLRVEHSQTDINKIQYKDYYDHPNLDSANYKLTYNNKNKNIGVYSFCMCPGGYVLTSSTEPGTVVSNGMSNYNRNSPYANSAIVVTYTPPEGDVFSGLDHRTHLEKRTYDVLKSAGGDRELPAQTLIDFLNNKKSTDLGKTSSLSGAVPVNLVPLFSKEMHSELSHAFHNFDKKMKGFINPHSKVFAIESRTSCPIRITRDNDTLESLSHKGLYPCGEGAGYAGGITSAACDGVKIADKIYENIK